MGEYYIKYPDELYHYGVKGMRWGIRHDPERSGSGRSRSRMSTAKKVAIGVGVAAAVAGVTYAGIKTGKAKQIAKGAVRLARRGKRKSLSGYQLRKMGISTFEPNRVEINRGTPASAARQAYYQRHGKSFVSSNITTMSMHRTLRGYSNKNYTNLGRAYYKSDLAQHRYSQKLANYKKYKEGNVMDVIGARQASDQRYHEVQEAVNKAYLTGNYKRTKSINYRNLTRKR